MTLTGLIGLYVRQNWRPYLLAALMLAAVSALTVFIPRQVGHVVDGLVAGIVPGEILRMQLGWLLLAGVAIYFCAWPGGCNCLLRATGWAPSCVHACMHDCVCRGRISFSKSAPAT